MLLLLLPLLLPPPCSNLCLPTDSRGVFGFGLHLALFLLFRPFLLFGFFLCFSAALGSQLAARSLPLVPFLPFYCCLLFVVDDGKSFCQLPAEVLATLTSTSTSGMFYAFSYDFTSPSPPSPTLVCGEQESERPCKLICTFEMCAPRRQQQ